MDRLGKIRIKNCAFLTHGEKDWLISEIERLRKELLNNVEKLTDIFERTDRIATGNVSHNVKWLKLITNVMIIQNRQVLKEE